MRNSRRWGRMANQDDFIYENAPLLEVIAEVRWSLLPLRAIPGSQIDPHFGAFADEFSRLTKQAGFGSHERVVPEEVPLEMVGGHPVMRFRSKPGTWPLFQIGPGLFTANIVPPYEGWKAFKRVLRQGIDYLFSAYPLPERYLKLNRIELRYIDAFTYEHGYSSHNEFLSQKLQVNVGLPEQLLDKYAKSKDDYFANIDAFVKLKSPESSTGILTFGRGKKEDKDALIGQLAVRREESISDAKTDFLMDWFDEAHLALRAWFDILAVDELKTKMGPVRAIVEE